jgi:hypothetical protein
MTALILILAAAGYLSAACLLGAWLARQAPPRAPHHGCGVPEDGAARGRVES